VESSTEAASETQPTPPPTTTTTTAPVVSSVTTTTTTTASKVPSGGEPEKNPTPPSGGADDDSAPMDLDEEGNPVYGPHLPVPKHGKFIPGVHQGVTDSGIPHFGVLPPRQGSNEPNTTPASGGANSLPSNVQVGNKPSKVVDRNNPLADKVSEVISDFEKRTGTGDHHSFRRDQHAGNRRSEDNAARNNASRSSEQRSQAGAVSLESQLLDEQIYQVHEACEQWILRGEDPGREDLHQQVRAFMRGLMEQRDKQQTKSSLALAKTKLQLVFGMVFHHIRGLHYWVKTINKQGHTLTQDMATFAELRAQMCLEALALMYEECMLFVGEHFPEHYANSFDQFRQLKDRTKRVLDKAKRWQEDIDLRSELSTLRVEANLFSKPLTKGYFERENSFRARIFDDEVKSFKAYQPRNTEDRPLSMDRQQSRNTGARRKVPAKTKPKSGPSTRLETPELESGNGFRPPVDGATSNKSKRRQTQPGLKVLADSARKRAANWVNDTNDTLFPDVESLGDSTVRGSRRSVASEDSFHTPEQGDATLRTNQSHLTKSQPRIHRRRKNDDFNQDLDDKTQESDVMVSSASEEEADFQQRDQRDETIRPNRNDQQRPEQPEAPNRSTLRQNRRAAGISGPTSRSPS
jgi:hypothetical protein